MKVTHTYGWVGPLLIIMCAMHAIAYGLAKTTAVQAATILAGLLALYFLVFFIIKVRKSRKKSIDNSLIQFSDIAHNATFGHVEADIAKILHKANVAIYVAYSKAYGWDFDYVLVDDPEQLDTEHIFAVNYYENAAQDILILRKRNAEDFAI